MECDEKEHKGYPVWPEALRGYLIWLAIHFGECSRPELVESTKSAKMVILHRVNPDVPVYVQREVTVKSKLRVGQTPKIR